MCVVPCVCIISTSSAPPGPGPAVLRWVAMCQFLWRVGHMGASARKGIASE